MCMRPRVLPSFPPHESELTNILCTIYYTYTVGSIIAPPKYPYNRPDGTVPIPHSKYVYVWWTYPIPEFQLVAGCVVGGAGLPKMS